MKKYFIIITVIAIVAACKTTQQIIVNNVTNSSKDTTSWQFSKQGYFVGKSLDDTLHYLKTTFEQNKQEYIGKEFSLLQKNLKMQIKTYTIRELVYYNSSQCISTEFWFYDTNDMRNRFIGDKPDIAFYISWEPALSTDTVESLILRNKGKWTVEEEAYFGKQMVKDVEVYKYQHQ